MVKHSGKVIETVPLSYTGSPSIFEGQLNINKSGTYEITVYAYDPLSGNTGVDKTIFKSL
jgi:hypothetical protein